MLIDLYRPQSGSIDLDGQNLSEFDPKEIRKGLIYIQQKALLFNRTLRDNLLYRVESFDASFLNDICHNFGLSDLISRNKSEQGEFLGPAGNLLAGVE